MATTDKNYVLSQIGNIVNTDANGAITSLNTSSYSSNLGPVGNITITGGSTGQVLSTNGSGVLNWSTITTNNVANANYSAYAGNVTIAAQANITSFGTLTGLTVSGTSNFGSVGNVTITGGSSGQMLSTNGSSGLSWTTVSAPATYSVGEYKIFLSSPPDSTWLAAGSGPYSVSSYPALGAMCTSTNAPTASASSAMASGGISLLAYGGGRYIRISSIADGTPVQTQYSTDGTTWTNGGTIPSGNPYTTFNTRQVWNGSVFFVMMAGSSAAAYTSPNGVTWTARTVTMGGSQPIGVAINGSTIAVLRVDNRVTVSNDNGATWTVSSTLPVVAGFISGGGGKFITGVYGGTGGAWSTDGITWTASTISSSKSWYNATWNGTYWVMFANDIVTSAALSYDGIVWTNLTLPASTLSPYGSTWNGKYWLIHDTQGSGTLYYTTDLRLGTWTAISSTGSGSQDANVASDGTGNTFVKVQAGGTKLYTFTQASTFTAGTAPIAITTGRWFIKS